MIFPLFLGRNTQKTLHCTLMKKKVYIAISTILALAIAGAIVFTIVQKGRGTPEWISVRNDVLPQFTSVHLKETTNIITIDFSSTVDIGFVVSKDSTYQFISQTELDLWKVTMDMVYETAMRNLDKRSQNINVEVAEAAEKDPTAKYVIVELGDGFSAVRLLSSNVRKAIAREVGDEYIAAIPTRDFLIFWHKDFPLFEAFSNQVQQEFLNEKEYPLTPDLFLINKQGIQPVQLKEKT